MSRRNRIFIGIMVLFCISLGAMLYQVSSDLKIRYREAAEETMVDTAYLLANALETDIQKTQQTINTARIQSIFTNIQTQRFEAQIYAVTKRQVDLRAYVTDSHGRVIYDSTGKNMGKDFSRWHDVERVLAGNYGARTTQDDPNNIDTAVMYVAAPIMSAGKIIGVVSVGKPVAAQEALISSARSKLVSVALITLAAVLALLLILTVWLARPLGLTTDMQRIFKQEGFWQPQRLWQRIKTLLTAAFSDMRDALAGRSYTEEYVQNLTHEIKSPLTAIRAAAELLSEPMAAPQRQRFTQNITLQVQRMQEMIDRLLELASVEKMRTIEHPQRVDLLTVLQETMTALKPIADQRSISLQLKAAQPLYVLGDAFLLQRAQSNLVSNALDFSPANSLIVISADLNNGKAHITVKDRGAGVPDYALAKVFEKFYSLRRPNSDRKSSGLGLAFVREIAQLHGGQVYLENHIDGGAIASLVLPLQH
jgi:two-component system, OmpR family, sensor histidine kinase CreC